MTSSLVGSEMCIRDRYRNKLQHAQLASTCEDLEQVVLEGNDGRGQEAVSYTHLTLPTICSV
eukprot:5591294-Prorocentrum_lima.AAC.1